MKSTILPLIILTLYLSLPAFAKAKTEVSIEGGLTWQGRNVQRIPESGGTTFALDEIDQGPFATYRIYASHKWSDRHEVRALYAPLDLNLTGQFKNSIDYIGATFAANTDTQIRYKFNSYRLTYAYHFEKTSQWELALGFTTKVRDAEVSLTQGNLNRTKKSVGFVPLLNFQAVRNLSSLWFFRFDFDGLAAPQGRAFDVAFFLERALPSWDSRVFGGYRMVEGGADNKKVYNFAWFHTIVLGLRF